MRDTGATRNALYFIRDDVDSYLEKKSTVSGSAASTISRASKSTVELKKAINRKSMSNIKVKQIINEIDHLRDTMNSRCSHQKPTSTMHHTVGSTNKGFSFAKLPNQPIVAKHEIPNVTLVATNDYTKNISSFIFSPSLDHHPKMADRYKTTTSYQTPKKSKPSTAED